MCLKSSNTNLIAGNIFYEILGLVLFTDGGTKEIEWQIGRKIDKK